MEQLEENLDEYDKLQKLTSESLPLQHTASDVVKPYVPQRFPSLCVLQVLVCWS